jgi:ATP-dependent Clp protease ATP-binding subunit ClpC
LRRLIQNLIEDPLAEGLLNSRFQANSTIRVEVEDDLFKLVPVEELAVVSVS